MRSSSPSEPAPPWLILVPTELELDGLKLPPGAETLLVGFGPIAAAASLAAHLGQGGAPRSGRILLIGIAGTLDPEVLPVGSAALFSRVACDGVGAGQGQERLSPSDLGFPQLAGPPPVFDELPLAKAPSAGGLLVTACAASATKEQARSRAARFPGALAEDMEAFGAALACHLLGLELFVVRGISNLAGERDKEKWQVQPALAAAAQRARELIEEVSHA